MGRIYGGMCAGTGEEQVVEDEGGRDAGGKFLGDTGQFLSGLGEEEFGTGFTG